MGFFSKVFKGIKKVVKSIGKGIKSAVGKVGKFMNKIGIVGQIGLALVLPGIGSMLGTWAQGMMAYSGVGSTFVNAAGQVLNFAVQAGTKVGNMFSTVTEGVTKVVGETVGAVLNKVPGMSDVVSNMSGGYFDISNKSFSSAFDAASNLVTDAAAAGKNIFTDYVVGDEAAKQAIAKVTMGEAVSSQAAESLAATTQGQVTADLNAKLGVDTATGGVPTMTTTNVTAAATTTPSLLERTYEGAKTAATNLVEKAPEKIAKSIESSVTGAVESKIYEAAGVDTTPDVYQTSYQSYVPTLAAAEQAYAPEQQFVTYQPSKSMISQNPYGYSASLYNADAYKQRMSSYGYAI